MLTTHELARTKRASPLERILHVILCDIRYSGDTDKGLCINNIEHESFSENTTGVYQ